MSRAAIGFSCSYKGLSVPGQEGRVEERAWQPCGCASVLMLQMVTGPDLGHLLKIVATGFSGDGGGKSQ